jgi:hypothetical protein
MHRHAGVHRTRPSMAIGLGVGLLLAACEGGSAWPPVSDPTQGSCTDGTVGHCGGQGVAVRDGHAPFPAASAPVYSLEVGKDVPVSPGVKIGYSLIARSAGSYRFRWTGDDAVARSGFRKFYGSIWTTGHFTSLVPGCDDGSCPLEPEGDYVSDVQSVDGGERIDWHTFTSDGWDGFSFTTDTEPVYFDVNIEVGPHPELLEFPSSAANGAPSTPAANPFGITSVR